MSWQEEEIAKRRQEEAQKAKRQEWNEVRSRRVGDLWHRFLEENRKLARELQMPVARAILQDGVHFIEAIDGNRSYRSKSIFYDSSEGYIFFEAWRSAAGYGLDVKYAISYYIDEDFFFAYDYSSIAPIRIETILEGRFNPLFKKPGYYLMIYIG